MTGLRPRRPPERAHENGEGEFAPGASRAGWISACGGAAAVHLPL
jgi:hypothetical protein